MERNFSESGDAGNADGGATDPRFVFGDEDGTGEHSGGGSDGNSGSSGNSGGSGDPVRRKRGRPALSDAEKRERARTRKTRSASQETVSASIDGLTRALLLLHFGIAAGVHARTKNETLARVFAISPEEARMIAEPAAELMTHYVGVRSPETQRWINLGMALTSVYGGKLAQQMIAGRSDAHAKAA